MATAVMDRLDRTDRLNGGPHSNNRSLPDNPAQGVRRHLQNAAGPLPNANAGPPPPMPPLPNLRGAPSNAALSAHQPLSASQVIASAREAMKLALEETETQAAEASAVSTELKPGVTIDLSRKGIQKLPEEVVDIIKNELERSVDPFCLSYLLLFPLTLYRAGLPCRITNFPRFRCASPNALLSDISMSGIISSGSFP